MIRFPKAIRWLLTKIFANEKQPYLKEIGVDSWAGNHFGGIDTFGSLRNAIKCKRTKKKTGVDPRDCWDMDSAFFDWLYTHLCQLLKDTNCDLTATSYEHNGKTYTEGEYIEYLKDLCRQVMLFDEFKDCPDLEYEFEKNKDLEGCSTLKWKTSEEELEKFREQTKKNHEELQNIEKEVFDVFYELLHSLWW